MKKLLLLITLGLLAASMASGSVPNTLAVQGRLLDGGVPLSGSHPATFRIFDVPTGGASLWTESGSIDVQGGIFTAVLGATTPIPTIVFDSPSRWLEVTVDAATLSPRIAFSTSAYSFRAQRADTAEVALSGTTTGGQWETDGTSIWRVVGDVGIGTSSPLKKLHVNGNAQIGSRAQNNVALTIEGPNQPENSASAQDIRFSFNSAGSAGIRSYRGLSWDTYLQFLTNPYPQGSDSPLPRMTIDGYGQVGIGTTAPGAPLDVAGAAAFGGQTISLGGPTGLPNERMAVSYDGNATRMRITTTPNVSLGLGSGGVNDRLVIGPTGDVTVTGAFTATGTKCRLVAGTTHGDLYYNAVESGEAIFTTSGRAQLRRGRCHVEISPKWLAGVTVDERHPLDVEAITFYGPHGHWYVRPGSTGFDLIDSSGTDSSFFWVVQARQRGYEDLYLDRPAPAAALQGEQP